MCSDIFVRLLSAQSRALAFFYTQIIHFSKLAKFAIWENSKKSQNLQVLKIVKKSHKICNF